MFFIDLAPVLRILRFVVLIKVLINMGFGRFKFLFTFLWLIVARVVVSEEVSAQVSNVDRASLLTFMSSIISDPELVLENWNSSKLHFCSWTGIRCNRALNHVVQLDLSGKSLGGIISPALSNLSSLRVLDLSGNMFTGEIPAELGALSKLKQLSLSSNLLEGEIPAELGYLPHLVYLDLGSNLIMGQIPPTLFCNGSSASLEYIDLSNNSLSGVIPLLDNCELSELKYLLLWSNKLVGQIPAALAKSSKLQWLDLESNSLSGELPSDILNKMPHLQFLYLSDNDFISHNGNSDLEPLFASLVNCSNIQEIELAGNNLGGEIPSIIGNLSTNLLQLHLGENLIYGSIPPTISNLVNLTLLNLSSNLLKGSIPPEICRMQKLERIFLSNNSISGEIPSAFGEIPHLGLLDLSKNRLSGTIPDTLSNLTQLRRLLLYDNQLSGIIPPSLGKCINLEILDLSRNQISGPIPNHVIAGLTSLKLYLNLSSNNLDGPIPLEFSKMDMVLAIDLSSNRLTGSIPAQIGACIALEYLNLSFNLLQGVLPVQIGNLPYLQELDVSSNKLFGELPDFLQVSSTLGKLNISFNNFSGTVPHSGIFTSLTPESLQGNPNLCGFISSLPNCRKKRGPRSKILSIILTLSAIPILCLVGYPLAMKSRARLRSAAFEGDGSVLDDEEQGKNQAKYPKISYRQLVEATGGFNGSSLIGSGRFGHVYKGTLGDNTRIAVKIMDSSNGREISRSFKRECQVLKRTRHRNLVRIITTCSRPDFNALVLPLMPNGSLESHLYPLHDQSNQNGLSLVQIVSICSDVAEGVAYLHHYSPVRVIHCDLKPSNILLDEDMTALVTDFGISRLVKDVDGSDIENAADYDAPSLDSTAGLLCGSVGYIPPEYGLGRTASTQGDVYSFGVLLLEIVTGKRPTDVLFEEGSSLHEWVRSQYPNKLEPIVKEAMLRSPPLTNPTFPTLVWQDVITELIELGLVCTHYSPSLRPSMIDVAQEMSWLKQYLLTTVSSPPLTIIDASDSEN